MVSKSLRCRDTNAIWTDCKSNCPPTCASRCNPLSCTQDCKTKGCQCKSGYLVGNSGKCVTEKQSPTCPDPNANWADCKSNCPPTCASRCNPLSCTQECKTKGCQCKSGYLVGNSGKCVTEDQCTNVNKC
ncbi:serine protease inhibitor swm-1-like [Oppia nitens]|uniref:serine protease inhibitor swm-1-like n=1 Tax=Oppia nitens TaxID=1686743 RepID=UPI0023DBA3F8|nr:serine protease inhibitor swm-1-like [Oppia nitens]